MAVMARYGDFENEGKFQKLASIPRLAILAKDEKEHMRITHDILDQKLECEYMFDNSEW